MIPTRVVSSAPTGTALSKYLIALQKANGSPFAALEIAEIHCRTVPQVGATLEMLTKTAIGAGTMTSGGGPVSQYIGPEAYLLLLQSSIFGKVVPSFREAAFRSKSPRELGAGAGAAWVGEGLPIPVVTTTFDNLQQEFSEAAALIVLTAELFKFGNASEATLRAAVIAGVARFVDAQLLDPSVTASALRPASLTNGAAVIVSTGNTAATILADLANLIAAIKSPGDSLRWVLRPLTYYTICAKLAAVGFPVAPGTLLNIPVVLGSTSPAQITLLDCAAIVYSSDHTMALDVTTQADVQMSDAPTQDGTVGTGAQMVSLFQNSLVAVKAGLATTWQHTQFNGGSPSQPSGVAYMVVVSY
jgi:HK97 family phage major capsid protein